MQCDWGPYKKGKFGHRDTHGIRTSREHEGRDRWGDASASQGTSRTPANPQKLERDPDQILCHRLRRK